MGDQFNTREGSITVVGVIFSTGGPFVFFDSPNGREVMTPKTWEKFVRKAPVTRRAEEKLTPSLRALYDKELG